MNLRARHPPQPDSPPVLETRLRGPGGELRWLPGSGTFAAVAGEIPSYKHCRVPGLVGQDLARTIEVVKHTLQSGQNRHQVVCGQMLDAAVIGIVFAQLLDKSWLTCLCAWRRGQLSVPSTRLQFCAQC